MLALFPLNGVVGLAAIVATAGDTLLGVGVAGAFSLANTVLGVWLVREQRRTRSILTAPRRMVFDAKGHPIGTVLDLRRAQDWLPAELDA